MSKLLKLCDILQTPAKLKASKLIKMMDQIIFSWQSSFCRAFHHWKAVPFKTHHTNLAMLKKEHMFLLLASKNILPPVSYKGIHTIQQSPLH